MGEREEVGVVGWNDPHGGPAARPGAWGAASPRPAPPLPGRGGTPPFRAPRAARRGERRPARRAACVARAARSGRGGTTRRARRARRPGRQGRPGRADARRLAVLVGHRRRKLVAGTASWSPPPFLAFPAAPPPAPLPYHPAR